MNFKMQKLIYILFILLFVLAALAMPNYSEIAIHGYYSYPNSSQNSYPTMAPSVAPTDMNMYMQLAEAPAIAQPVDPVTAIPEVQSPKMINQTINCYDQDVKERSFSPAPYPKIKISSPTLDQVAFTAVTGSLEFYVDMPYSSQHPYKLGEGGDFIGKAQVCNIFDPSTGQSYDTVTLSLNWAENSGGVYNVYYSYIPYEQGAVEKVISQNLYFVDAEQQDDDVNECYGGSSEEYLPIDRDLVLTPREYFNNDDDAMKATRSIYTPFKLINSVPDLIKEVDLAYKVKKDKLTVVLASHGHVDRWVGWFSYNDLDQRLPGGLRGNEKNVIDFAKGVQGKISSLYFESCCTGKGKTNGWENNILDTMSYNSTKNGDYWTQVCGWTHLTYTFKRRKDLFDSSTTTYHKAHSKGDQLICSSVKSKP